jgi:hypothetical protein
MALHQIRIDTRVGVELDRSQAEFGAGGRLWHCAIEMCTRPIGVGTAAASWRSQAREAAYWLAGRSRRNKAPGLQPCNQRRIRALTAAV